MANANAKVRFQLNASRSVSSLLEAICHYLELGSEKASPPIRQVPSGIWTERATGVTQGRFQRYNSIWLLYSACGAGRWTSIHPAFPCLAINCPLAPGG